MTELDPNEPPNLRPGYPLGHKLVDGAWRAAWELLAERHPEPAGTRELVDRMRKAGPVMESTARQLLRTARINGTLTSELVGPVGRQMACYKISDTVPVDA